MWQPTSSIHNIKERAKFINKIRSFFANKNITEVFTPILAPSTTPDAYIESFTTQYTGYSNNNGKLYLQTSPEFAMKRLLAANIGDIWQLFTSFRNGEAGKKHNPEFTMLEWYRVGIDHFTLMQEVDEFMQYMLGTSPANKTTYKELFKKYININPHSISYNELKSIILDKEILTDFENLAKDDLLDILFTNLIEPNIAIDKPLAVYNFCESQAALSKIVSEHGERVAQRFEFYYKGFELANGYNELTDADEQERRFTAENNLRIENSKQPVDIDYKLIEALKSGMPECAGVAIGIDRLFMLALESENIADAISFTIDRI